MLYKPWRRYIDKKRLGNAHFEPLSQNLEAPRLDKDEDHTIREADRIRSKDVDISVVPVAHSDLAGPSRRQ